MLEGLDSVRWAELQHACGPASDVPGFIRDLLSPEQDVRDRATVKLFETIWHQGSVYEASSYAVPFLQELLLSGETPDKVPIALLLAELACGNSYIESAIQGEGMERLIRDALEMEGRDFERERVESRRHVEETRIGVGRQLPLLYPYLECAIPDVRRTVAAALGQFPARWQELVLILEHALAGEGDYETREAMRAAITALAPRAASEG